MRTLRTAVLLVAAGLLPAASPASAAPSYELIPLPPGATSAGQPVISASGNVVVYASVVDNVQQVYAYDRKTRKLDLVSAVDKSATAAGDVQSWSPSVSGDGRYVVFISQAKNLIGKADTNGGWDLYLRDRLKRRTSRVSVDYQGKQLGVASQNGPAAAVEGAISEDGSTVAFVTNMNVLKPQDPPTGGWNLYAVRTKNPRAFAVSVDTTGSPAKQGNVASTKPQLSADGRYVVFGDAGGKLTPDVTTDVSAIYKRDTKLNKTSVVASYSGTTVGTQYYQYDMPSMDGKALLYAANRAEAVNAGFSETTRTLAVVGKGPGAFQTVMSHTATGSGTVPSEQTRDPKVSADGLHVVFTEQDLYLSTHMYSLDLKTSRLTEIGVAPSCGTCLPSSPSSGSPSRDGKVVVFTTSAALVPADTDTATDVYVQKL